MHLLSVLSLALVMHGQSQFRKLLYRYPQLQIVDFFGKVCISAAVFLLTNLNVGGTVMYSLNFGASI